jgi:two-component system phosphate regulon response regulator PhoB
LLVEDDENDFVLFRRACRNGVPRVDLVWARTVSEAKDYLLAESESRPSLLITDWEIPGSGGAELLRWAATQPAPKQVPFVVLSNASTPANEALAYELGALDYRRKPAQANELIPIVQEWARRCTIR